MLEGPGDETADQIESIGTTEERQIRIVCELLAHAFAVPFGHVGQVGDDAVEGAVQRGKQIAFDEIDAIQFEGLGVFLGER